MGLRTLGSTLKRAWRFLRQEMGWGNCTVTTFRVEIALLGSLERKRLDKRKHVHTRKIIRMVIFTRNPDFCKLRSHFQCAEIEVQFPWNVILAVLFSMGSGKFASFLSNPPIVILTCYLEH